MKEEKDADLDKIFKKGLGGPVEAGYREQDWNALEQMLDEKGKRRGLLFWLPILSSAAVFLILFGWWFLRPEVVQHQRQKQQPQLAVQPVKPNDTAGKTIAHAEVKAQNTPATAPKNGLLAVLSSGQGSTAIHSAVSGKTDTADGRYTAYNAPAGLTPQRDEALILTAVSPGLSAAGLPGDKSSLYALNALPANVPNTTSGATTAKHNKAVIKSGFLAHPQYALSFVGAPELNGVNSLQQTRSGTNLGVLFSVGVLHKLTITTGAQYSIKPYDAYFSNRYSELFNSDLTSINADCRVLDIPLNVDYQLFGNYRNKFSVGSGLSSYIMLHESYQYNYSNPATGPVTYTVPNTNKYIFDIVNLQATYTRQVTSKVGLSLTPYLKLPLTGIGANQAKLQTTGVAIGLSWNLNSNSKP